ncbi:MAG: helix-turn-helix domain-containing protein [Mogibacterium sp.]|nr:helix-turn-helix domain-containing protein [Mogibacterium sp.]
MDRKNPIADTVCHLLDFDKYTSFESALKEAAIRNDFQVILLTTEFNPILTVETRHIETIDGAITNAKRYDVTHSATFTKVMVNSVITYWGTIDIAGVKHLLFIVDNEDKYTADDAQKLANAISLAMGLWKYTPERDSRAEFIKAAIRGDAAFCRNLMEEAGLRNKMFISVFYANGINNQECQEIIDRAKDRAGFGYLPLIEKDELYGMIYIDKSEDVPLEEIKGIVLGMYDELKEGRKEVRIFHSTGMEDINTAVDGFKMINDTWNSVETVFPYKRVFTKYEMSMVYNCISIRLQNPGIRKMYLDLLEPFSREVSANKGKMLLDTLETFVLDAGMNSIKTSEFMNVHNNTVQYRLKRINELLGAEMTGNRIIPGLTMALALRRLEDKE